MTGAFSDEATFHLSGLVNRQNMRFWGTENPHKIAETKSFSPKVIIWAEVSSSRILDIGPYFFEDEDGHAVTVKKENYVSVIETYFVPHLRSLRVPLKKVWSQNDNVTSGIASECLKKQFQDRLIGKDLWPA